MVSLNHFIKNNTVCARLVQRWRFHGAAEQKRPHTTYFTFTTPKRRYATDSATPIEHWKNVLTKIHNSHIAVGHIPKTDTLKVNIEGMEFDLLNFHNFEQLPLVDSPFGRGTQTLVDKTVRNSREYTLKNDIDKRLNILGQAVVNDVLGNYYCSIPYKVTIYEKDSFFLGHVDTPEDDLMYTLVLALPSKYKGGDLVFGELFNTTEKMLEPNKYINFVLFRINCPHRVERVTEGYRASITFKVYKIAEKSTRFTNDRPVLYDMKLPKLDEPNILIAYPNPDEIVELLKKSGINFMFAYGEVRDDITKVYSTVRYLDEFVEPEPGTCSYDTEEHWIDNCDGPGDIFTYIALGETYNISKIINIGFQKSFIELRGDTGNEGYTERFRVHYMKFILINPTNPGSPEEEDVYYPECL